MISPSTAIPVFLCTPSSDKAQKEQRLSRLPTLLYEFICNRCRDSGISTVPGEPPDAQGEVIVGAAIIQFGGIWGPMVEMNDEKRSMFVILCCLNI